MGPNKKCAVTLTDDNTLKNETTTLANETSLHMRLCMCVSMIKKKENMSHKSCVLWCVAVRGIESVRA